MGRCDVVVPAARCSRCNGGLSRGLSALVAADGTRDRVEWSRLNGSRHSIRAAPPQGVFTAHDLPLGRGLASTGLGGMTHNFAGIGRGWEEGRKRKRKVALRSGDMLATHLRHSHTALGLAVHKDRHTLYGPGNTIREDGATDRRAGSHR